MHNARARLCGFRVRAFGWRRNQRLDELVPKTNDLFAAHIAADHALGQPQLERLIDDAAVGSEIDLAKSHEVVERHIFGHAAPACVQNANNCSVAAG